MKINQLFKGTSPHPPKSTTELELEKRLKNEVTDARKLYTNRWIFRVNIFGQDNIHEFYQSSTHFFVQELHSLRASFLEQSRLLQQYQNRLHHYTLLEGEEMPKLQHLQSLEQVPAEGSAITPSYPDSGSEFPEQKLNFTVTTSAPKDYIRQVQQYEAQVSYGIRYADLNLKKAQEHYKIEEITLPFKASEVTDMGDVPKPESNMPASVTRPKVLLTYAVVIVAIIPEFITFSKVLSGVFHVESGFKKFFLGFTIVLLSKVFSILLFGTLLEFLKRQNKIFKLRNIIVNKFALFLTVIGLALCISLGALYYRVTERDLLIEKIVMLRQNNLQIKEEAAVSEVPLDEESRQIISENNGKIKSYKKRLEESESKTTLKVITISLFSAVVLLFSSSLFAFAWIFSTVLFLKNKAEQLTTKIHQIEGRFNSQKIGLQTFQKKIYSIFRLIGELEYLRRTRENFSENFEIFDAATSQVKAKTETQLVTEEKSGVLPLKEEKGSKNRKHHLINNHQYSRTT